jgi:hypothetical protein
MERATAVVSSPYSRPYVTGFSGDTPSIAYPNGKAWDLVSYKEVRGMSLGAKGILRDTGGFLHIPLEEYQAGVLVARRDSYRVLTPPEVPTRRT